MSQPFHALPLQQQAELVFETSYYGISSAELGYTRFARQMMMALEDMAVEGLPPIHQYATSRAAGIRQRLGLHQVSPC